MKKQAAQYDPEFDFGGKPGTESDSETEREIDWHRNQGNLYRIARANRNKPGLLGYLCKGFIACEDENTQLQARIREMKGE